MVASFCLGTQVGRSAFICISRIIFMITDSSVSASRTSEETFLSASYSFIFPVPKCGM